jgi:hypothetical protein
MMIIAEEWLNGMKRDKATKKLPGDLNPRILETSTMWKILSLTRTIDQAQEEDSQTEEGEEEEDHRNSRTTIQEIRTSTTSITEGDIAPNGAQKPKRTSPGFSKRKQC